VWNQPLTEIARKYNVSTHILEKICENSNIPLPKAGHWMKVKYGKKVIQPPLQVNGSNNSDEIINLQQSEIKLKTLAIKKELEPLIKISNHLSKPVDLVVETRKNLLDKKGRHHNYNGLIVNSLGLDLKVSSKNIPRALKFWDIFIKNLQNRGHLVRINHRNTIAEIKGINFELFLRECTNRELNPIKKYSWNEYLYHPNGIFALRVEQLLKEWKDGRITLEDKLPDIIAALEIDAADTIQSRRKMEEERLIRIEKERIEAETKKKQKEELTNFKKLLNQSERWNKAVKLRKYLNEVEAKGNQTNSLTESLKEWLDWARDKADWYDPFIEKEDKLLKVFNIKTFENETENKPGY